IVTDARPREVIVTLGAGATANTVYELSQDLGLDGDTLYTSNLLGTRVVRFRIPDTRSVADVVQQLSTDARVQLAQPNYVFTANGAAAKPLPVPQYAPQKLHLGEAHKVALGRKIKIAVIDTAIDAAHPAFGGAITATFDALGETKGEAELHGTSIAGIVGARAELTGVAPEANILAVRAFAKGTNSSAQSHTLAILKGLDWAALNGARVVNMSFAGPNDPLLGQAIAAAVKQGIVVIAAAGNGGPGAAPAYPGAFPNVIAVTAIDDRDTIYKNANRGTYVAVAAPGVDIVSAGLNGGYELSSGTSMAAAHVSGVAALMLDKNPKLTPKDIRDALSKSAHQPPRLIAEDMGAGIVDAAEALKVK
ncbi:MAG: S8 family serine peptidase, partial [Hyphomicrobium sp.]